jgi:hypothetical protein
MGLVISSNKMAAGCTHHITSSSAEFAKEVAAVINRIIESGA